MERNETIFVDNDDEIEIHFTENPLPTLNKL